MDSLADYKIQIKRELNIYYVSPNLSDSLQIKKYFSINLILNYCFNEMIYSLPYIYMIYFRL